MVRTYKQSFLQIEEEIRADQDNKVHISKIDVVIDCPQQFIGIIAGLKRYFEQKVGGQVWCRTNQMALDELGDFLFQGGNL